MLIQSSEVAFHYEFLTPCGYLGEGLGYLRAAYSDEETAAMGHFIQWAENEGAIAEFDALKNVTLTWNPDAEKFIEFCSHVDTVPNGGNYDGAAGIVAGVLAASHLHRNGDLGKSFGVRVQIFRGEEAGTYRKAYLGSSAAHGFLDPKVLDHTFQGIRLRDAMISQGVDPKIIEEKTATISQERIDSTLWVIELHIEQGPELVAQKADIGVVTGIRGSERFEITVTGQFAHSGTTPMDRRKDAILASAYIIVGLDTLLKAYPSNEDIVQTVGEISGGKGVSIVSGHTKFLLDVRSCNPELLGDYLKEVKALIGEIAAKNNVEVMIQPIGGAIPVPDVSIDIINAMEQAARALDLSSVRLPSGAGHDITTYAQRMRSDGKRVPIGMVFIPNTGESHSPSEDTTHEAIADGANALVYTAVNLFDSM